MTTLPNAQTGCEVPVCIFCEDLAKTPDFGELAEMILNDYRINRRKSLKWVELRLRVHLAPFFVSKRAHKITMAEVQAYIAARQSEGAKNGTINLELAALKRMFALAIQAEKITKKPHIPLLEENNIRQGFFERAEYEAVLTRLPEWLR